MRIGDLTIVPPVILAPMAGVTNRPFRRLCRRFGAGLVCTEMISARALTYRNLRTEAMLHIGDDERPVSAQLLGADPEVMARAARIVVDRGADIVDINMGCAVPKVLKTGGGAALLERPDQAAAVVAAVAAAVDRPVTVKMRLARGDFDPASFAAGCVSAGAAAVAVHPRLTGGRYPGPADWSVIARVKAAVPVPVIGSGDVRGPEDARRMFGETGCDGVMVARAALGRPWIFRSIAHFLATGELLAEPDPAERLTVAADHARSLVAELGEQVAAREMRKHLLWYARGFPRARAWRERAARVRSWPEIASLLAELLHETRSEHQSGVLHAG